MKKQGAKKGKKLFQGCIRTKKHNKVNIGYKDHIPQIKGCYYESRNAIIKTEARNKLSEEEQKEISAIENLCEQFKAADIYVLAAPMWSLSFPSTVKEYLDCVIQTEKTISFENNKPEGLLKNKQRIFIYVQSSGGSIPCIIKPILSKGSSYVRQITKFIGISSFHELFVDNTGKTEEERQEAIRKATNKIPQLVGKLFS